MRALLHRTFADFWPVAERIYRADPVQHTVPLLIASRDVGSAAPDPGYSVLLTVTDGVECKAAALATADVGRLLVSALPVSMVPPAADALDAAEVPLTGATGPIAEATAFAENWTRRTGSAVEVAMRTRLYALGDLTPPTGVPGHARAADVDDLAVLGPWWERFRAETGDGPPPGAGLGSEAEVRRVLDRGATFVLWEVDGRPVSWASFQGPVERSARIAPVFTPAHERGRGYGSAVTAAAAALARTRGATQVVLFTNLANPVSNSIYQKIGFRPVHDAVNLRFQ